MSTTLEQSTRLTTSLSVGPYSSTALKRGVHWKNNHNFLINVTKKRLLGIREGKNHSD